MEELGLAASELAIDLADTTRLEAAMQDLVPVVATGADLEARSTLLKELSAGDHAPLASRLGRVLVSVDEKMIGAQTYRCFPRGFFDLLHLDIGEALDVEHLLGVCGHDELGVWSVAQPAVLYEGDMALTPTVCRPKPLSLPMSAALMP